MEPHFLIELWKKSSILTPNAAINKFYSSSFFAPSYFFYSSIYSSTHCFHAFLYFAIVFISSIAFPLLFLNFSIPSIYLFLGLPSLFNSLARFYIFFNRVFLTMYQYQLSYLFCEKRNRFLASFPSIFLRNGISTA